MLLYRYIVKEHIFPFLASLSIIVFLFIMQQAIMMLDKIVSKNIDPIVVLEVFLIQLGWILALGIPMAVLSSTLMTFGRMAGDNEITAIKASGRGMSALVVPVMAAAATVTVALFFFHDLVLPEANHRAANLLGDISRKRPAAFIEPGVLIRDFQDYALYVEEVNALSGNLKGIRVFTDNPGQDPSVTVAESGNIRMTGDGEYLELSLFNGETHGTPRENIRDYFVAAFKKQVVYIKNVDSRLERTSSDGRGDREMTIAELLRAARTAKESNAQLAAERGRLLDSATDVRARISADSSAESTDLSVPNTPTEPNAAVKSAAMSKKTARRNESTAPAASNTPKEAADGLTALTGTIPLKKKLRRPHDLRPEELLNRYESRLEQISNSQKANLAVIAQYMVEVHKKFAIPAACLIFVLIGAPLGIMARRGGLAVGASYSVFFFIMYWVFLITGENMADRMVISPAVGMWAGNAFLVLCGVILIVLMTRETTIGFGFLKTFFGKLSPHFKRLSGIRIFALPGALMRSPRRLLNKAAGTLPGYLIWIFMSYAVGLLAALIVIFVTIDYVSNLRKFDNAAFEQIILYYQYFLPFIVLTVLPIVLFLSSMFSVGRLAKLSELTAMKAAGVNVRQLTMPLLLIGLLLSGGVFYGGEMVLPRANERRALISASFGKPAAPREGDAKTAAQNPEPSVIREYRRNFFYFAAPNVMYYFNEFCTSPQFFRGVRRYVFTQSGLRERVDADAAEFDDTGWRFVKGQARAFAADKLTAGGFDVMPDSILTAVPSDLVKRVKSKEAMSYWELASHIEAAKHRGEKAQKFMAELQFKIALPFMNFIVILFGISLASRTGRRGGTALLGVGLLLSFLYWILSRFALVFAQNGYLPTLVGAWVGNVIFFIVGLALYRKAAR
ncbi:MAG: LptF/LptG family permease [Chitinispirillales bacterium]|jgi:lipopolysaccharide export system permease protein|nr:LptF/LptG family permease [Chitinispirillales bacterium]